MWQGLRTALGTRTEEERKIGWGPIRSLRIPLLRVAVAATMQSLENAKFLKRNREHRSLNRMGHSSALVFQA